MLRHRPPCRSMPIDRNHVAGVIRSATTSAQTHVPEVIRSRHYPSEAKSPRAHSPRQTRTNNSSWCSVAPNSDDALRQQSRVYDAQIQPVKIQLPNATCPFRRRCLCLRVCVAARSLIRFAARNREQVWTHERRNDGRPEDQ